jgi:hypothetical protein
MRDQGAMREARMEMAAREGRKATKVSHGMRGFGVMLVVAVVVFEASRLALKALAG